MPSLFHICAIIPAAFGSACPEQWVDAEVSGVKKSFFIKTSLWIEHTFLLWFARFVDEMTKVQNIKQNQRVVINFAKVLCAILQKKTRNKRSVPLFFIIRRSNLAAFSLMEGRTTCGRRLATIVKARVSS